MTTQYAPPFLRLQCPVCGLDLRVGTAEGRKSKKPFITLVCPQDGRHFRAFINDKEYVTDVLNKLEQMR